MTDFQKTWVSRRKKWEHQEQVRIGDIYEECVKRGCNIRFLKQFDTRIWMYPIEQTRAFIETDVGIDLKMWKTYLQVLIEKRPNHEKSDDWKKSLLILGKYENS